MPSVRKPEQTTSVLSNRRDGDQGGATEPDLVALREILVGYEQQRLTTLQMQISALQRKVEDEQSLIRMLTPVLGDAIRTSIRDHRQEMIEALYPIIGQLVVRAVSEAIRDLARGIDQRMRMSFSPAVVWRRVQARLQGVSAAELALRDALPFMVAEIFLIHRTSGLLLLHISWQSEIDTADADLIGGLLTAIRDFVQEAFGRGQEEQLDEIHYGDLRILIEAASEVYLGVVVEGVEPAGFPAADARARLRYPAGAFRGVARLQRRCQPFSGSLCRPASIAGGGFSGR